MIAFTFSHAQIQESIQIKLKYNTKVDLIWQIDMLFKDIKNRNLYVGIIMHFLTYPIKQQKFSTTFLSLEKRGMGYT